MSCILRLIGTNLDVDSIQSKITIAIDSSWKKGEPRFSQKENSKLHEKSGVTYLVSNAEFEEFEIQKIDAPLGLHKQNTNIVYLFRYL